jgi:hypothetical protein
MSTYATQAALNAEIAARKAGDTTNTNAIAALAARVAALEGAPAPTPTPDPTPPPVPGQKVVPFSGTAAQFTALIADTTVDVIEIAAGTYLRWSVILNTDRTARPLLVRPAAGAAVIFDGMGISAPPFYVGWNSLCAHVTFDPAGTGGSFTLQNYSLGQIGLVDMKHVSDVTFNAFIVRNCTGTVSAQTTHCLYVESDGTHRSARVTANGWNVVGPSNRYLCGVQTYHEPNVDGLTLHGWTVTGLHRAAYLWADATGIDVDGWTISSCDATFDAEETASGTIKNCHATNSGKTVFGSGYLTDKAIVDGGGNSWA